MENSNFEKTQTVTKLKWHQNLRLFHSLLDFLNPIGQCRTFETLKSLKQKPKGAFTLSLGNSMEKLPGSKPKVCTAAARGLETSDFSKPRTSHWLMKSGMAQYLACCLFDPLFVCRDFPDKDIHVSNQT